MSRFIDWARSQVGAQSEVPDDEAPETHDFHCGGANHSLLERRRA